MKEFWVWHPDIPGKPVRVRRGFLARLLRPRHTATKDEVMAWDLYQAQVRHRARLRSCNRDCCL